VSEASIDLADIAPDDSLILDALEQFAQFVDELYDTPRSRPIYWEGNPNRVAIRSVGRILCKWRHAVKPNRPPSALIVRLARRLPAVLSDVAGHPKRILQRRRAMEPLNRLRELDSNCVRWLTKQPGSTLAEKSGHRRAVLAVQRFESVDTLENRVVRDLLRRCGSLAANYLRQYRSQFPNHEWIRMTDDFLKLCRRLESLPHLQEVSGLPSLPKPNYVLLHESRYREIWRSYTEVIRQQRRRQQLWTSRHQAFADMATVAWMNSASRLMSERQSRKSAHRFELRVRETPLGGSFFDWTSCPPVWSMTRDSAFYVGPTESLRYLPTTTLIEAETSIGNSIVSWDGSRIKAWQLQVNFPGESMLTGSEDLLPDDQVAINLIEINQGSRNDNKGIRMVVPLALSAHPNSFDRYQSEWLLS
jgi:hypothetical protein